MGVLHALQLQVVPVHPANWKRALGLAGRGVTKDDSRELAVRTFPSLLTELKRKKDHGEDRGEHPSVLSSSSPVSDAVVVANSMEACRLLLRFSTIGSFCVLC